MIGLGCGRGWGDSDLLLCLFIYFFMLTCLVAVVLIGAVWIVGGG